MNICFVGLGSIARRHIKNLNELYPGIKIDVLRHTEGLEIPEDVKDIVSEVFTDISRIKRQYDVVFITNPTGMHYETLNKMKNKSDHFFIEKPVFETGNEDVKALELNPDSIYYVACPLRYTNVIQYLKNNIEFSSVFSVRVISSSYLPDWRPGTDYRKTYSAHRELGGGVSIDLIHEWDYLYYLLGEPLSVHSIISRKSMLEINSDDIALYIAEYEDKTVELHLDYFGRVPARKIELFCQDDVIEADLIDQRIIYKKSGKQIDLTEDRNSYQKRELLHFFSIADGVIQNDNTIENACKMLIIARGNNK